MWDDIIKDPCCLSERVAYDVAAVGSFSCYMMSLTTSGTRTIKQFLILLLNILKKLIAFRLHYFGTMLLQM